ncbi:MAG: type II 3-dehydroquinate dehydratase [Acidimicrobiia bacterium]|nr:type II 3-dehydroquinate dehydratase [Acidimicrobiia bacterium]
MKILVLNGPNLNLLGTREPEIYGHETLDDLNRRLVSWAEELGVGVESIQTNHEGQLVDQIQREDIDALVINPAAYSYTSRAIQDAIAAVRTPTVEVHISNIKAREPWRADSLISSVADYTIFGRGLSGYRDAMRHLVNAARVPFETKEYGTHPEQVGDLRVAGNTLAVLVHGGFWLEEWTRDTVESLAVDLSINGISTWNLEYRRLGSGGGWPASADDVRAAIDHTPALGAWNRVVVIGHSAGGYMAIWAAEESAMAIDLIVALAPITDLRLHAESRKYAAGVATELIADGAPEVIEPGSVPLILVHGSNDDHVPVSHSLRLAEASKAELITTNEGHFELLDPGRPHWPEVRRLAFA